MTRTVTERTSLFDDVSPIPLRKLIVELQRVEAEIGTDAKAFVWTVEDGIDVEYERPMTAYQRVNIALHRLRHGAPYFNRQAALHRQQYRSTAPQMHAHNVSLRRMLNRIEKSKIAVGELSCTVRSVNLHCIDDGEFGRSLRFCRNVHVLALGQNRISTSGEHRIFYDEVFQKSRFQTGGRGVETCRETSSTILMVSHLDIAHSPGL